MSERSQSILRKDPGTETASTWKNLYKTGSAAALVMVVITLTQFVVFFVAPPPIEGSATDWFALSRRAQFPGYWASNPCWSFMHYSPSWCPLLSLLPSNLLASRSPHFSWS